MCHVVLSQRSAFEEDLQSVDPSAVFPRIGVPQNHPFIDRMFYYKPSILGYLNLWKPHLCICIHIASMYVYYMY